MNESTPSRSSQSGALMIEVLIAIAIVVFGMLAVMKVESRLQLSEVEAYQRTQALILLNDMANRIETNRNDAARYITDDPLGVDADCDAPLTLDETPIPDLNQTDQSQWCNALQGAAESQSGTGAKVGAMVGARGCIEEAGGEYMVTVTWQGMTPISAPPASVTCAFGSYNDAATSCVDDLCRRYVSTVVRIANLEDI